MQIGLDFWQAWQNFIVRPYHHQCFYEGYLGTSLELQLLCDNQKTALHIEEVIKNEITRLEQIFSIFSPNSELNRLHQSGTSQVSPELLWVLERSLEWTGITEGAFNPAIGSTWAAWNNAIQIPINSNSDDWEIIAHRTVRVAPSTKLNLNAIAKGRIADLVCQMALSTAGVEQIMLNLGGDICHAGTQGIAVAIEGTTQTVRISNQGLATSGISQRHFSIAGQRYSQIFDPRSNRPIEAVQNVTVIAPDASSADVLATAFSVLTPTQSLALADDLPEIACLICDKNHTYYQNKRWSQYLVH